MALYDPVNMWGGGGAPRSGARPATATSGLGVMNGGSQARPGVGSTAQAPQSAPMGGGQPGQDPRMMQQMLQQLMMLMGGGQRPPQQQPGLGGMADYLANLGGGQPQMPQQPGLQGMTDYLARLGGGQQPAQRPQPRPGLGGLTDYLAGLGGQQPFLAPNTFSGQAPQGNVPPWLQAIMGGVQGGQPGIPPNSPWLQGMQGIQGAYDNRGNDPLASSGMHVADIVRGVAQGQGQLGPNSPWLQGVLNGVQGGNVQGPAWMQPIMNAVTGAQQPNMASNMLDNLYNNRPNDALASSGMHVADIVRQVANRQNQPQPGMATTPGGWSSALGAGLQGLGGTPTGGNWWQGRGAHPGNPQQIGSLMDLMRQNNMGGWSTPQPATYGGTTGQSNFTAGGEGGAMGAPAAAGQPPMVGQRSVAQMGGEGGGAMGDVGSDNTNPVSAPVQPPPAPAPTTPPRFSYNDIAFMARQVLGPQMAAAMGFGAAGETNTGIGFFDFNEQGGYPNFEAENGGYGVDPHVLQYYGWGEAPPEDFNSEDFYNYFLNPDTVNLRHLYSDPLGQENLPLHRNDRVAAIQDLYDYMAQAEQGLVPSGPNQPPPVDPNAPPANQPPITGPGSYGETERDAFRRPWSSAEQDYFDFGQAALTGRGPKHEVSAAGEARVQAMIDADMAAGRIPDVARYVKMVSDEEYSNPGTKIYDASMGIVDPALQQQVREQASTNMGNIGMRFSTDANKAIAATLQNQAQGFKEGALNQQMQIQSNIAAMQGLREQAAHSALYDQFIRSLGLPEGWNSLMELLKANIGSVGTTAGSGNSGAMYSAIGSGLQGLGGLAGAYANSNPYNGQIPTLQGSTGPLTYSNGAYVDQYGGRYR